MAGIRLLVLCSVVVAATCQLRAGQRPTFCLELLRSDNRAETARALLTCVNKVKSSVERTGRQFQLQQQYSNIGRCIAQDIRLVDANGNVDKEALRQRVARNGGISEEERAYYLRLVPECHTWDGCLTKHCKL